MSPESLSADAVARFLEKSARALREAASELDALDAQIGDGDLGTSAATLFEAAIAELDTAPSSAGLLLSDFGDSIMRLCSGASGTLYAVLFTTLGTELKAEAEITLEDLAQGFRHAVERVKQLGGASPGDATMIDAIEPFVETLEEQAVSGAHMSDALTLAAVAADRGATSTSTLIARLGRARGFGDRTLGHVDPGARSFAVIVGAWGG